MGGTLSPSLYIPPLYDAKHRPMDNIFTLKENQDVFRNN
jgi:hypothetical protein